MAKVAIIFVQRLCSHPLLFFFHVRIIQGDIDLPRQLQGVEQVSCIEHLYWRRVWGGGGELSISSPLKDRIE